MTVTQVKTCSRLKFKFSFIFTVRSLYNNSGPPYQTHRYVSLGIGICRASIGPEFTSTFMKIKIKIITSTLNYGFDFAVNTQKMRKLLSNTPGGQGRYISRQNYASRVILSLIHI